MSRPGSDTEDLAQLLRAKSVRSVLDDGEDVVVARREGVDRRRSLLGRRLLHRHGGDLEALQGPFGLVELFGDPGDLVTQLVDGLLDELLTAASFTCSGRVS